MSTLRLTELISFARQIDLLPEAERRPRRGEPDFDDERIAESGEQLPNDDPNSFPIERPPIPVWIPPRDGLVGNARDGGNVIVRDGGDAVIRVEGEISRSKLPSDLSANPPIDTLAYYLPFHLHETNWGIYLRESGILLSAIILKGAALSPGDFALLELGRKLLLDHERLHFQAEVACARAEVIAGCRLYDSYFRDGFATSHEEALANALAFRAVRREPPVVQSRVTTWMKHQGTGYRDFDQWTTPAKYATGCRLASQHMLKSLRAIVSRQPAEFVFDSIRFKPPIYMVLDVSLTRVLKAFPKKNDIRVLVHTREHRPPHIHIETSSCKTRYIWPELRPLERDPELSSRDKGKLEDYLERYGSEIDTKVRSVYSDVSPWAGSQTHVHA